MSLESYLKFIHDFELNKILKNEEIIKLFKNKTKALRMINLGQFIELFTDLCL